MNSPDTQESGARKVGISEYIMYYFGRENSAQHCAMLIAKVF